MSNKITFKVAEPNVNRYYSVLKITDIRHEDGSAVKVQKTLDIAFKSPVEIIGGRDFSINADPWEEISPTTTNTEIDSSTFAVAAKLPFPKPYTINDRFVIDIGINGDMTKDIKRYTESIVITQDSE
ncbi:hypothetical protein V501_06291 [Pseudogymnoascus sp. VKM F-4519 (FW-2642)]|nr:hypothetical protein V501_06291 [Pseudogymnoascus sp. VKM F-4519 (FW-2642)]